MSPEPGESRDDYLDRVLVGGREHRPVVIVDYDERWPGHFEVQRDGIVESLGSTARRIEHIGSTSVPGLAAKPIIDVVLAVPDVEDEPSYRVPLQAAGYVLRVRESGHRMFRTPGRDVHLHVYTDGGDEIRRNLMFRDRLRTDPAERQLYEATKRALARRPWRDMNDYADAKTEVVEQILRRAETAR